MRLALKKHVSIRIGQNDDLGSHFLMPELFQMKIIGSFLLCSFTFNLYLGDEMYILCISVLQLEKTAMWNFVASHCFG